MPIRAYYNAPLHSFVSDNTERLLGVLTEQHHHTLEEQQRWAWLQQILILKEAFAGRPDGCLFLEFYIPRMGKRADAVLVMKNIVFVIEFKIGASEHSSSALDQVEDYALDLKNFHEGSHTVPIVPVLISTNAESLPMSEFVFAEDLVASPVKTNMADLKSVIDAICAGSEFPALDIHDWMTKGYKPTPTIVEAAEVLYRTHNVTDISRSDAGARNLQETSNCVSAVIDNARRRSRKSICFVTGVPGSGKTLAGLNISTRRSEEHHDEHAVFLSGNGPLVEVLREALARDKAAREGISKKDAERAVRSFIQNIHHFRDHYVGNEEIPLERVVVFDEAQRAWTRDQAANFMQRKRGQTDFDMSRAGVSHRRDGAGISIGARLCALLAAVKRLTQERRVFPNGSVHLKFTSRTGMYIFSPRIALPEYGSRDQVAGVLVVPESLFGRIPAPWRLNAIVPRRSAIRFCRSTLLPMSPQLHDRSTKKSDQLTLSF